jgi:hypothetical protein
VPKPRDYCIQLSMALILRTETTQTKQVYKVLFAYERFCIFEISGTSARVYNWTIFGNSARVYNWTIFGNCARKFLLRPKSRQSIQGNGICSESTTLRRRSASWNRKILKYELYNNSMFLTDTNMEVLQQVQTKKTCKPLARVKRFL